MGGFEDLFRSPTTSPVPPSDTPGGWVSGYDLMNSKADMNKAFGWDKTDLSGLLGSMQEQGLLTGDEDLSMPNVGPLSGPGLRVSIPDIVWEKVKPYMKRGRVT